MIATPSNPGVIAFTLKHELLQATYDSHFAHSTTMQTPARRFTQSASLCPRCLLQRRRIHSSPAIQTPQLDSSTTRGDLPSAPPPPSGIAHLTRRRLISLHGPDAPKFLQGIITANVRPEARTGFYTAFLTAQGKVLCDAFVYPTLGTKWHSERGKDSAEAGFLVEVDGSRAETLAKHLRRHKLRAKLDMRLLDREELQVWSAWREEDRWTAHTVAESGDGELGLTDGRAPGMGWRMLASSGSDTAASLRSFEDVPQANEEDYRLRRYLRGVAEGQDEIPWDESLPMNCNIDIMGGIDFKKGCYIGQELTIRTHHTGVVRRRILPVMLFDRAGEVPDRLEYMPETLNVFHPAADADIRRDDLRKRATGKFIAGIGNVGLAMCRLEQMSDVAVSGEGSSFTSNDRFTVQGSNGADVGVKAFVPAWLRGQIREPKIQRRVE